jgi:hypothetical protein
MASSNGIHVREFSHVQQWQKTKIGGTTSVSSDSFRAQPAPFPQTRPRWRAGKMGADGASPSKDFERRSRAACRGFGGTTAVSSDSRGAQSRPIPADRAALVRVKNGR